MIPDKDKKTAIVPRQGNFSFGEAAAHIKKRKKSPDEYILLQHRIRFFLALILTILVIFSGRLLYLQFFSNNDWRLASDENRLDVIHIAPLRGRILASDGTVLADSRIAIDLLYTGGDIESWQRIASLLELESYPENPDLSDSRERRDGKVIVWNIDRELIPALEELLIDQPIATTGDFRGEPSLYLRKRIERFYPEDIAPHVLGYTTEADPERFEGYQLGLVGLNGVEQSSQILLYGEAGRETVERNNMRRLIRTIPFTKIEAVPGEDVTLSIDPRLQRYAEEVLEEALQYVNAEKERKGLELEEVSRGALIAMNPHTGAILALASYPDFDPNVFTRKPSESEEISRLLNDNQNFPLLNRAVSAYPPASTFKLMSSLVLLENGFISGSSTYPCSGSFFFLGVTMRNWAGYARGNYTVAEAIADSCNTFYFAAVADTPNANVGWASFVRLLTGYARYMGFGNVVGIGLEDEKSGLVPDDEYSRAIKGYAWRPGDSLNISIGQGDMLATPIQVTQMTATIAMDGYQAQPFLVQARGDEATAIQTRIVEGSNWQTIKNGMRLMMTRYGGMKLFGPDAFPIEVAGKTGTAQNGLGPGYEHSWFAGFGPFDDPEIVLTVFIENGGSSTNVAVPVARDFFSRYWSVPIVEEDEDGN